MPNFLITDYYVPLAPLAQAMLRTPFVVRDSYVELPTGPGPGVDVDGAVFKEYPYRPGRLPSPAPVRRRGAISGIQVSGRPSAPPAGRRARAERS